MWNPQMVNDGQKMQCGMVEALFPRKIMGQLSKQYPTGLKQIFQLNHMRSVSDSIIWTAILIYSPNMKQHEVNLFIIAFNIHKKEHADIKMLF